MKNKKAKRIVTVLLLVIIFTGSIESNAYTYIDEMILSVCNDVRMEWEIGKTEDFLENGEEIIDDTESKRKDAEEEEIQPYADVAADFLSEFSFKQKLIEINGTVAKSLNLRELYKNNGGVVLNNGYVVGIYPYTSTDYEVQQMVKLKNYLDERNIPLLYVNEPVKYITDRVIEEELGIKTYVNDNTDRFLSRLEENEISYIDLRNSIVEKNLNSFDLFYKTDHHWTTLAGKMAAEEIAKKLNDEFGYKINLSLYDTDKFIYKEYRNAWLGEQGKKLGESFVGLDNFTLILPDYDTSFYVSTGKNTRAGSFGKVLVDQSRYLTENNEDVYETPSWHYSYVGGHGTRVRNGKNARGKKVLVLGDSYEYTMLPFLALGLPEVQCLNMRAYGGNLKEYIEEQEIDTVVVAYASFMIGAHDNQTASNYAMFDFF